MKQKLLLWQSNPDRINWIALLEKSLTNEGILINFRGTICISTIFIFFEIITNCNVKTLLNIKGLPIILSTPDESEEFGLRLVIRNSSSTLEPLVKEGDMSYLSNQKSKWLKELPKVDHSQHKLLVLPYY